MFRLFHRRVGAVISILVLLSSVMVFQNCAEPFWVKRSNLSDSGVEETRRVRGPAGNSARPASSILSSATVNSFTREPWGVRIGLSNGTEVLVYLYKNNVVRIRQTINGETPDFEGVVNKVSVIQGLPTQAQYTSWENTTHAGLNSADSGFKIVIQKNPFNLSFYRSDEQLLTSQTGAAWSDSATKKRGVALTATQDENFIGIGGQGDYSVNRKGINARIWNTHIDPDKGNDYQNPFFISSRGYGFLAMNSFESWLKLNHKDDGLIQFESAGGLMDYFLFEGDHPKEILSSYHWLTGYAPLPPRWAFGLWMSRTGGDEQWVRMAVDGFRQRKIPLDMVHMEGITAWTHVSPGNQALQGLWSYLEQMNVRKGIWQGEIISKRYSEAWWNEADRAGFFTKTKNGNSYLVRHFGDPAIEYSVVDFGNPNAFNWFKSKHTNLLNLGYDNVMVDGGVEEDQIKNDMLFENGRYSGEEYHNIFTQVWVNRVRQIQLGKNSNRRPMAYVRGGWTGVHRFATSWGGDQCWTYDALKNLIRKGISEGATGISFWSQDSGGFHVCWQQIGNDWLQPPRTRNFYERSVQWGAWNPIFRIHGQQYQGVGNEPWQFGGESERIVTEAIRERYRLLPYFYSLAYQARESGLPLMRAMALEFPDDRKAWNQNDQHMVGSEFLVAPITSSNNTRSVYLPEGDWYDYYDSSRLYPGGGSIQYTTTPDHIPVFIKAGAVIPKAPVIEHIADGAPQKDLILSAYKGPASSFVLYEDDGVSLGYERGQSLKFKIERWSDAKAEWIRIYKPEGQFVGMNLNRRITFELRGYSGTTIKSCRLDRVRTIDCSLNNGAITATTDWNFGQEWSTVSLVVEFN